MTKLLYNEFDRGEDTDIDEGDNEDTDIVSCFN